MPHAAIRQARKDPSDNTFDLSRATFSLPAEDTKSRGAVLAYLEEALEPPDLENALRGEDKDLKCTPPLDPTVRALRGISVGAFADNYVGLFVFDLGEEFR